MKNLYYLAAIIFSCSSFGQNSIKNYEIGCYVDYNKKIINGYHDFDYAPKTTLNISYTAKENFAKGYYFDKDGLKINGLLKYSQGDRELKFKLNENDREKSIKADESNGYVIGIDTFSVVKNVIVIGLLGDKLTDKSEFAENIETVAGIKFYKFTADGPNGVSYARYIVKNSESPDFVTFPSGNGKFKKLAVAIFGSDPVLKSGIENGKYKENDIPSLIKIFKYRKLYAKGQNIFYNSVQDETSTVDQSAYYSKIESVQDSVFHLSHFFNDNMKIYDGNFTSFYPHNKQDDFSFYYPNGGIRRMLSFKNNKPKEAKDFFVNGKTHRVYDILEQGTLIYKEVYNEENGNVLDKNGNGNETFLDVITDKKITYEYENKKLKSAYFTALNGEKIYQLCENNAEIKKMNGLQKLAKDKLTYPIESVQKDNHGYVLVKCIVEPSGLVSEISLIKGLDFDCDKATLDFLSCFKSEIYWKPGKVDGKNVKQEIIFPVDFSINISSSYRNNYYNFWFNNTMMMQQMMMQQQQMMRIPAGRF